MVGFFFLALSPFRVFAEIKYVPTPQQLQPPPVNVRPNLSGNINYIDPGAGGQSEENIGSDNTSPAVESRSGTIKIPQKSLIENVISLPGQNNFAGKTAWWLIVLILAGAGTLLVKKRHDKK